MLCKCVHVFSSCVFEIFTRFSLLHIVHSTQVKNTGTKVKVFRICVAWASLLNVCWLSVLPERVFWARILSMCCLSASCLNASSERVLPEHVAWARLAWARCLSVCCLNASSERVLPEHVAWARLAWARCLSVFPERVFWACVSWARCLSVSFSRVLTWVYIPLFLTQMALHSPSRGPGLGRTWSCGEHQPGKNGRNSRVGSQPNTKLSGIWRDINIVHSHWHVRGN